MVAIKKAKVNGTTAVQEIDENVDKLDSKSANNLDGKISFLFYFRDAILH
jgi:hypothetical protein